MIKEAIILAGGFGTRLSTVVNDRPKPMALINEKPFLEYMLNYLISFEIKTVIISTGYLSEIIRSYFGSNYKSLQIIYSHEEKPMGTGGGIRLAIQKTNSENILVLNGDTFFDVELKKLYKAFNESGLLHCIVARKITNAGRYGQLEVEKLSKDFFIIKSFKEKSKDSDTGLINGGVYLINKADFLAETKPDVPFAIESDFFSPITNTKKLGAFISDGYFIDIGIPEDYLKAQDDFKEFKY